MVINLLAGVLGIVLYTLIKARAYVFSKEVKTDWGKLLMENVPAWLWALLVLFTVSMILHYSPESNVLVGQVFGGMDLTKSFTGFLGLGMFLSFGGKELPKKIV
ncbi:MULTISPECIES: hypothetical protein [unclassified Sphingobacterium]|uniref:hypothetical protein n=1 Tax=unclassified Sphingobacterium TaxID=2609468 RepID=UPI002600F971|nr:MULTISPECIES: hypothetical protein [unclassified Sphingobacterium]